MTYMVRDIFLTIQGEGFNIGKTAVFVRFSGCNLWSGRESDRRTAVCKFCDTDFIGGNRYTDAKHLTSAVLNLWPFEKDGRMVVLTGGEPALQLDVPLVTELHEHGFYIAVETNGTLRLPEKIDWICVSPKSVTLLELKQANELKLVFPQHDAPPESYRNFRSDHRWLSPMDGPDLKNNTQMAVNYCIDHSEWRLAIQAHKIWQIP